MDNRNGCLSRPRLRRVCLRRGQISFRIGCRVWLCSSRVNCFENGIFRNPDILWRFARQGAATAGIGSAGVLPRDFQERAFVIAQWGVVQCDMLARWHPEAGGCQLQQAGYRPDAVGT